MKLYYYIVWNHGIKHIEDILNIIRNEDSIKINKIYKINPNLNDFLQHVYRFDKHVSKEHIMRKNKFLITQSSTSFLIIVENYSEIIKQTNSGKIYCERIDNLKWKIREKYNPRYEDVTYDPYPGDNKLSKGIKHEHMIHSCDIPKETTFILNYFNYSVIDLIKSPCKDKNYLVPSRLKNNFDFKIVNVNVDEIKASLVDNKIYKLEDTPHYKYLYGDKEVYRNYVMQNLGICLKDDHLPGAYDKLIQNFDYNKLIDNKRSLIICYDTYVIKDGLHRACICKKNGVTNLDVMILLNY